MSIHERNYFNNSKQYATLSGKWDLYVAFTETSLRLLIDKGIFTFIIPFGFLNQPFAEEIRKFILKDYSLLSIADLHNNKIFESATIPSCIPVIERSRNLEHQVKIVEFSGGTFSLKYQIDIDKYHQTIQNMFRTENLNLIFGLIQEIRSSGEPLDTNFYVSTGAEIHGKESRAIDGTTISGTSKFDVLKDTYSPGLKPYIEGAAIEKSKEGRYSYPVIDKWLDYSKKEIMRSPKSEELFDNPKIIIRGSSGLMRILAIYDRRKIYTSHKCIIVIPKEPLPSNGNQEIKSNEAALKLLLAILNSKLIDFYYESVYGGFIDVYPNSLKELPICKTETYEKEAVVVVVDYLLFLKSITVRDEQNFRMCNLFDSIIDAMVFELYFRISVSRANANVIGLVSEQFLPLRDSVDQERNLLLIETVYKRVTQPNNEIRNRIIKQNIAIADIKIINQSQNNNATSQVENSEF